MLGMSHRSWFVTIACLAAMYLAYCSVGYSYLRYLNTYQLVYFAIFPSYVAFAWRLIPDLGNV